MNAAPTVEGPRMNLGEPGWRLASDRVEAWLTERGGCLGPVRVRLGERWIEPYAVPHWAGRQGLEELPVTVQVMRGDFFAAPFGRNSTPFAGERHPVHGEPANGVWDPIGRCEQDGGVEFLAEMRTSLRPGVCRKRVRLLAGQPVIYQQHVLSGYAGPMTFGVHPMLRFPRNAGSISCSPILHAETPPEPFEAPQRGGRSSLAPDRSFTDLSAIEAIAGGRIDASRFPFREGSDDLVMLHHRASEALAWTAVVLPDHGALWFSLKDPRVLTNTILWMSNGGRPYFPWEGRHTGVLGVEDVTSWFHYGLSESVRPNSFSRRGIPTHRDLRPDTDLVVNHISGFAPVGPEFRRVCALETVPGGVVFTGDDGSRVEAGVDWEFLDAAPAVFTT